MGMKLTAAELAEIRSAFRDRIAAAPTRKQALRRKSKARTIPAPVREPDYADGDVLTTRLLAEVCGVSTRIARRWADAGILPSFRTLGGHRRFRWAEVKRWLNRPARA
jgi:excisionase family DNA binding protein